MDSGITWGSLLSYKDHFHSVSPLIFHESANQTLSCQWCFDALKVARWFSSLESESFSLFVCSLIHFSGSLHSQVTPEGTFLDVRTIGRFCYEDDLLTLSAIYTEAQAESQPGFPRLYTDKTINSLKHRLLVYLWRRVEQDGSATAKRRYAPPPPPPPRLSLFVSLRAVGLSEEHTHLSSSLVQTALWVSLFS